jgi:type VI secretion system secreted protein Hcp
MAYDAFLKLEGPVKIEGEATADGFANTIQLFSFSWGVSNPVTIGAGTGGGSGKASLSSFNFMKMTDKASPSLFQACCNGTHFTKITVTLRKAGGEQLKYLIYEFEKCFIESVQWSGSSGGDDRPAESVSFAFGKVTINYQPQDDKGQSAGEPVRGSWDVELVK